MTPETVRRSLYQPLPPEHFLSGELAISLVSTGHLVPYHFASDTEIIAPRIPFVSYPYEWCNAQFFDAAELMLTLSETALRDNFELKDASAWNVIFDGCNPMFCDHLSFQKIRDRRWWALAQYVRHFILPLCLAKYRQLNASASFALGRDGISPDQARGVMGLWRFATRYWILMLKLRTVGTAPNSHGSSTGKSNHKNLYGILRWLLDGVRNLRFTSSTWINYTTERSHYTSDAISEKYRVVKAWLAARPPSWVIDLGCNTGEFSKLAASGGAKVVAIDLDHESVQSLYLSSKGQAIYPVVANFDDLYGGRGWAGREFPGLFDRLHQRADMLLMLAVVHHLAISSAIPYTVIAETAAKLTTCFLIIELLEETDPLVRELAMQRNRDPAEFSISRQIEAFDYHFKVIDTVRIPETARQLFLMEKR